MWSPRRERRVPRAGRLAVLGTAAAIAAIGAAFLLLPLAVRALVRALELTLNGSLLLAASLGSGADIWTIAATVATAAGRVMVTTPALVALAGLVVVGAIAVYALQRLFGADEERSK